MTQQEIIILAKLSIYIYNLGDKSSWTWASQDWAQSVSVKSGRPWIRIVSSLICKARIWLVNNFAMLDLGSSSTHL